MKALIKFAILCTGVTAASGASTVAIARSIEVAQYGSLANETQLDNNDPGEIVIPEPVLSDTDYFITSLMSMGNLTGEINGDITYNNAVYNINADVKIGMEDVNDISAYVDLSITSSLIDIDLSLTYINQTIYLDLLNNSLKIETTKIADLIDVIKSFDIQVELPEAFNNIDLSQLMTNLATMQSNKNEDKGEITYNFVIAEGLPTIQFTSDLDHQLTKIDIARSSIMDIDFELGASVNVLGKGHQVVECPENATKHYVDASEYFGIANMVKEIFDEKKFGLSYGISIKKNDDEVLLMEGKADIDLNSLVVNVNGSFSANDFDTSYFIGYGDKTVFINYDDIIKLGVTTEGINNIVEIVENHAKNQPFADLLDKIPEISLPLVDLIKEKNYFGLLDYFSSVEFNENYVELQIDGGALNLDTTISLTLNRTTTGFDSISITGLVLNGYVLDIDLNLTDFSNVTIPDTADYSTIDEVTSGIDDVLSLIEQRQFALDLSGSIVNADEEVLSFSGDTQFDLDTASGTGTIQIIDKTNQEHNVIIDVTGPEDGDHNTAMVFDYFDGNNNHMKGQFSIASLNELISMISGLLNSEEARWKQYVDLLSSNLVTDTIDKLKDGEYEAILIDSLINDISINNGDVYIEINGKIIGETSPICITSDNENGRLVGLSISGTILDLSIDLNLSLKDFDYEHQTRLELDSSFIDFGDIVTLAKCLLNTAELNAFELTGNLTLGGGFLASVINLFAKVNTTITCKLIIDDDENVKCLLKIKNIPVEAAISCAGVLNDNCNSEIYIDMESETVYVHNKVTSWISGRVKRDVSEKCTTQKFKDDILYYLVKVALNIDLDFSSSEKTETVYAKIIKAFSFEDGDNPAWNLTLDMGNLAGSDALDDLDARIVANEDGYISHLSASIGIKDGLLSLNLNASHINIGQDRDSMDFSEFYNYVNTH